MRSAFATEAGPVMGSGLFWENAKGLWATNLVLSKGVNCHNKESENGEQSQIAVI